MIFLHNVESSKQSREGLEREWMKKYFVNFILLLFYLKLFYFNRYLSRILFPYLWQCQCVVVIIIEKYSHDLVQN